MYNSHYGFKHRPFQLLPNPDYLYACHQYSEVLDLIKDGLAENKGPMLLTGDAGTGKTTLIRYMQTQFGTGRQVATIMSTNVSANEILRLILLAFKVNGVNADKAPTFLNQKQWNLSTDTPAVSPDPSTWCAALPCYTGLEMTSSPLGSR